MVDQQDRFYREVLELSKNNTSKHNVLYSKEKVDELIDKVLHAKTVLKSTSSLVTTEISPNSEETPVVQILNPNNSDNDVHLVERSQKRLFNMHENEPYQDSKFRLIN